MVTIQVTCCIIYFVPFLDFLENFLLFSFWRVPTASFIAIPSSPHTSFSCFFFLACADGLFHRRSCLSAHVIFLLFLFGVCRRPLSSPPPALRTRHFLAFFFLACAGGLFHRRSCLSAHVIFLLFSFWRVPAASFIGDPASPHTSFSCFFLFGVCRRPLSSAIVPQRGKLPLIPLISTKPLPQPEPILHIFAALQQHIILLVRQRLL